MMMKERAFRKAARYANRSSFDNDEQWAICYRSFMAGYLTSEDFWIPITEHLPKGYDLTKDEFRPYVLVYDRHHGFHVAAYEHRMKEFITRAIYGAYEESLHDVTHWRPLPSLPGGTYESE